MTITTAPAERRLLEEAPALSNPGWIPPDAWPELAELREQHLRILGEFKRTARAWSDLTHRYEQEDEARTAALQEGYRLGMEPELLDFTPPQERVAALAEAKVHYEAAREALEQFLREALAQMRAEQPVALERLRAHADELMRKRAEARRMLAATDAATADLDRLHTWVVRSGSDNPGFQVVWDHLQPTLPEEETAWAQELIRDRDEQDGTADHYDQMEELLTDAYQ